MWVHESQWVSEHVIGSELVSEWNYVSRVGAYVKIIGILVDDYMYMSEGATEWMNIRDHVRNLALKKGVPASEECQWLNVQKWNDG